MQNLRAGKQARGGRVEGFLGLKFSIPEFFWVGKFGWLDLSRDFLGIQSNLKIRARE